MWTTSHHSFPRAILHIDGDSFFASCEMALDPRLHGKPVVTGLERGIASSMSYEAKRLGVKRGMTISVIRKVCPSAIILPSDYETYSLFSKRMFEIVRRFTPEVEEYSIDECFADITGLRRIFHMSYKKIAESIKQDIETELGMTFSIGLAPTKVLAKVGSKWNKPSGLTVISIRDIPHYLQNIPVESVWGIGTNTTAYLQKFSICTAYDFSLREEGWVREHLSKPFVEIWSELRGSMIYGIYTGEKHEYQSVSKTKTFTPPSNNENFVFSQLSKNVENACIKIRRHHLASREIYFFLKTNDFRYCGAGFTLSGVTAVPNHILVHIRKIFPTIYRSGVFYRATGVTLSKLSGGGVVQGDLFGEFNKLFSASKVYSVIDAIDKKYGKHTVFLGASFSALKRAQHSGMRGTREKRRTNIFKGESERKRLSIPMLGDVR